MSTTTRYALLLLLVLMTAGMFYGYSIGTTSELKATLAMIYGSVVGMTSCVILLAVLPLLDVARRQTRQQAQQA